MAFFKGAVWVDITPTSGGSITVPTSDACTPLILCLNHTVSLLSLSITWPTVGVEDGQVICIASLSTITNLSHSITGGYIQGTLTTVLGGGSGIYRFRKSNTTWYKLAG